MTVTTGRVAASALILCWSLLVAASVEGRSIMHASALLGRSSRPFKMVDPSILPRGGAKGDSDEYDSEEYDEYEEEDDEKEALAAAAKAKASKKKAKAKAKAAALSKSAVSSAAKAKAKKSAEVKESVNVSLAPKTSGGGKSILQILRVPYIVRACLNPLTLIAMTKAYFASLCNIGYLEEDSSQTLRSALEDKAKKQQAGGKPSGGKRGKRTMRPGQAKTLSDLPQLSA